MLRINRLSRSGLNPVSFEINAGECLTLTGPSGAGKSLLLRAIADLDPNQGQIFLNDVERADIPAPLWRQTIGYCPAETGWWAPLVGDHFLRAETASPIITGLRLPADCLSWPVERLSSGEKQRLGLARLFERQPQIYLLDEPTAALDPAGVDAVERLILHQAGAGAGILLTTHDMDQPQRLASRRLHIENGRVEEAVT